MLSCNTNNTLSSAHTHTETERYGLTDPLVQRPCGTRGPVVPQALWYQRPCGTRGPVVPQALWYQWGQQIAGFNLRCTVLLMKNMKLILQRGRRFQKGSWRSSFVDGSPNLPRLPSTAKPLVINMSSSPLGGITLKQQLSREKNAVKSYNAQQGESPFDKTPCLSKPQEGTLPVCITAPYTMYSVYNVPHRPGMKAAPAATGVWGHVGCAVVGGL